MLLQVLVEFDAGFTISLDTSNMATPLPVTGVEALTDGLKLDITTTISKDAAAIYLFHQIRWVVR